MTSPFPGIDPFLESQGLWPDFHASFIPALRDALADCLPDSYVVRIDERMNLVEVPAEQVRQVRPDLAVTRRDEPTRQETSTTGTLLLEPVTVSLTVLEEFREIYLEILHAPDRKLVTVLELLSPSNKTGNGRRDYLVKHNSLVRKEVNLVELDFLVGGRRLPTDEPLPAGDYLAMVARGDRRPKCEVYAWSVRDRLPTIPIPLLPPDQDINVDLAPIFSGVYERARYARSIDYRAPLTIPLRPEDRAWAEALARTAVR